MGNWREHTISVMSEVDRIITAQRHALDTISMLHRFQQSLGLFHLFSLVKALTLLRLWGEELLGVYGWDGTWNDKTSVATFRLITTKEHARLLHLLHLLLSALDIIDIQSLVQAGEVRRRPHIGWAVGRLLLILRDVKVISLLGSAHTIFSR